MALAQDWPKPDWTNCLVAQRKQTVCEWIGLRIDLIWVALTVWIVYWNFALSLSLSLSLSAPRLEPALLAELVHIAGPHDMASPAREAASSVHGGVESREPSATAADQASRPPRSTQEHNKIGSEWLGPEPCSDHGPLGGADAVKGSAPGSDSCAMDCTPDTPEEEALLSKLGPKPKQRRRRAILRSYDQLVATQT